jgi:hypothetical protein
MFQICACQFTASNSIPPAWFGDENLQLKVVMILNIVTKMFPVINSFTALFPKNNLIVKFGEYEL